MGYSNRWLFLIIGGTLLMGLGIIIGVFGIKFFNQSTQRVIQPISSLTPISPTPSSFQFTDENTPIPSPTTKVLQLTYYLPPGWKTVTDSSGILEVGYNLNQFSATRGNQSIYLNNISYPVSAMSLTLKSYDGGSRHQFIYRQLGYTAEMAKEERMGNYYEVEYRYSGWNCLVLYGLGFSARGTTWGMCAVSPSQALFIEGGSEEDTKQLISTTKFTR